MEAVQYGGGLASVQWRDNMMIVARYNIEYSGGYSVQWGANISTVEAVQYSGGLTSVQRRDSLMSVGGGG